MASNTTGWFSAGSGPAVNTKCDATLTRNGTTMTLNWSVTQSIGSSSYLGQGSLEIGCGYAGNNQYRTMKEHSSSWSGGTSNTVSGTITFYDDSTTGKNFYIGFWSNSDYFSSSGIFNTGFNIYVEGYNPYANFSTQPNLKARTINTLDINYVPDRTLNAAQYRIKKSTDANYGSWTNMPTFISGAWNTGGTFRLTGLSANTTYKIQMQIQAVQSGPWRLSNELTATTYDYGKITAAANFNHGSNGTYTVTNPASATLSLNFKVGSTSIKTVTPTVGNGTISFTDSELDTIYRLYGNGSSLTGTYTLTTTQNSISYTNTRTCTITLTGNQKTMREKINNSWKRGKISIKVNNAWKNAVIWEKVNGSWKRGI